MSSLKFYYRIFLFLLLSSYSSAVLLHNQAVDNFPGLQDEVHQLPDVNFTLSYRHYSGYLESLNETYLHYWFFESQSDHPWPREDPLIVWLNGGPGCSSLLGAVAESGPLRLNTDGSVTENPYAWSRGANLLFIESPAGVGFSYQLGVNTRDPGYRPNDDQTAAINFEALRSFFRKFPHFVSNDFYLTGESYAGIYLPTLSMLILKENFPKKFRGISIGNALLDHRLLFSSRLQYGYTHGMVTNGTWHNVTRFCCPSGGFATFRDCALANLTYETIDRAEPSECLNWFYKAMHEMHASPTNLFNVKEPCAKRTSNGLCANESDHLMEWFNRIPVQQALRVYDPRTAPDKKPIEWVDCDEHLLNFYVKNVLSVRDMIRHLLDSDIKVLLYFGDTDLVCNYISAEWFLDDLNLANHSSLELSPWYYRNEIAGYSKQYAEGLTYIRILDAGHEVLRYKPAVALNMFQDFVQQTSSSSLSSSTTSSSSSNSRSTKTGLIAPTYLNSGSASIHNFALKILLYMFIIGVSMYKGML